METLIGICGIKCGECEAYIATQNNDDKLRSETADKWSKMFNPNIKASDINCDGCTSESDRHFSYCNVCEIRACGFERQVANCAYCDDYVCEKLEEFFKMVPENKVTLDAIREV